MRQWLLLWRVDRIEVISPMSLDEAEAALAASMETRRYGAWRAGPSADSHVITGRIHDRRVRVSANPPGTTNAWNAVLRAELFPLPAPRSPLAADWSVGWAGSRRCVPSARSG